MKRTYIKSKTLYNFLSNVFKKFQSSRSFHLFELLLFHNIVFETNSTISTFIQRNDFLASFSLARTPPPFKNSSQVPVFFFSRNRETISSRRAQSPVPVSKTRKSGRLCTFIRVTFNRDTAARHSDRKTYPKVE